MEDQRDSIVPAGCRIRARRARSATTWGERDGASARGAKLDGRAVERAKLSRAGAAAWARARRSVANDLCVILLRESRARRHFLCVITPSRDRVRPSFLSSELLDPPKNDRKKKTKETRVTEYLACIPCLNLGLGIYSAIDTNLPSKKYTRENLYGTLSAHFSLSVVALRFNIERRARRQRAQNEIGTVRNDAFITRQRSSGLVSGVGTCTQLIRLYFSRAIPRGVF